MFKDYDKYLSASLKVYLFLLVCCFILKLVRLDYFGLDINNPIVVKITSELSKTHIGDIILFGLIYIQFYFYLCMVCNKRGLYKWAFVGSVLNFSFQTLVSRFMPVDWVYTIWCILICLIIPMVVNKKIFLKRQLFFIVLINCYQLVSMFIRNIGVNSNYGNLLIDTLLNIDQWLLLAITYNLYWLKGGKLLCGDKQVVGSSLQMKSHFINLQKEYQKNYSNFKKLDKQEKATFIIYSILSLFWNTFTLVVVLFIAKLNDTFIECVFMVSSFWLSKKIFGKPFHLKSMIQCFILSNLTYYIMNRITTPTGISILIPIMLGVGLSYVTSKLVKKNYKPLYKGMSKEDFEHTILKVVDKNSLKYQICYDYFINKDNAIYLGHKYNYSEAGIRKITSRVNDNIKALN